MANITKIGAVVFVVLMAATALSFSSSGDDGNGTLDQIIVNDAGLENPHDGCAWDGDSKTLTVDSVTANRITFSFADNVSVTLMVKGDCKILNDSVVSNIIGIKSNVPLTITGSGSLLVEGYITSLDLENKNNYGDLIIDGLKSLTVDLRKTIEETNFMAGAITWSTGNIMIKNCEKIELFCRNGIVNFHTDNDSKTYDIHIENSFIVFNVLSMTDYILIGSYSGKIYCEKPSDDVYCTGEWMSEEPVPFESGKISCIMALKSGTITFGHYENGNSDSALVVFLIIVALVAVAVSGTYFRAKNAKNKF